MPLWIAVFLRCLPLDAARPQWPRDAAFAVLEQERIAALTPAAAAAGLQAGMRRAGAAAMAPEPPLLSRDRPAENRLLHEAALALLQYTPDIDNGRASCRERVGQYLEISVVAGSLKKK